MTHCASFPPALKHCASTHHGSRGTSGGQRLVCSTEPRNVIDAYIAAGRNFSATLIGDYEGRALKYVAKVHGGFTPPLRAAVFKRFQGLETKTCPFKNLPEARRGQWG